MERKKGQLIEYKMVNYQVKESADTDEEEVVEEKVEEVVGQEMDNDEQQTTNMKVTYGEH